MQLTPEQIAIVHKWVSDGLTLSEVQKRITSELGISMTYIQVRFLLDDLNLTIKDKTPPQPAAVPPANPAGNAAKPVAGTTATPKKEEKKGALSGLKSLFGGKNEPEPESEPEPEAFPEEMSMDELAQKAGRVQVEVDRLARPGAMVSGTTVFSDGMKAQWWVDTQGRLGLSASQKGYQPNQEDIMSFQQELQIALGKMGF
ncbi:MAG: hypothetical protein SFY80_15075 [Verrucomicrobiota bacterium]|nr:hypothetical protein [Verrucomicrobiota bacterium]